MKSEFRSVRVKVPGSTSNLGPCFDLCGLAIELYAEISLEPGGEGFQIEGNGEGAKTIVQTENNYVLEAMKRVWQMAGVNPGGARIRIQNEIPLYSGLGSSGAAIAGGLMAANISCGSPLSMQDLLTVGTEMEGHPDNVAASLLGGLVLSSTVDGKVVSLSYTSPEPLQLVVLHPRLQVATRESRQKLPRQYDAETTVFNVSRAAHLAAAYVSGRLEETRFAFEDKLHQPQRSEQMPYLYDAIAAAYEAGALGAFLSGSGPAVGALCRPQQVKAVCSAFESVRNEKGLEGRVFAAAIDEKGAQVLS